MTVAPTRQAATGGNLTLIDHCSGPAFASGILDVVYDTGGSSTIADPDVPASSGFSANCQSDLIACSAGGPTLEVSDHAALPHE